MQAVIVSFKVISNPWDKPRVLEKFLESPLLKCDKKPNPILEEMLDKAISTRSICIVSGQMIYCGSNDYWV